MLVALIAAILKMGQMGNYFLADHVSRLILTQDRSLNKMIQWVIVLKCEIFRYFSHLMLYIQML